MTLLIVVIILALAFDFINGFHDAANSIATVVSTKVLTPATAVIWAALFNFVAFFIFKDHSVANTISKTVQEELTKTETGLYMVLSGLLAAITWNLITWWYGIPSSSSHTLIGGFAGAFVAGYGWGAIHSGVLWATVIFIVVAPVAGMVMSYLISIWFLNSFRKALWMKLVSLAIIAGVCWSVWNALEFKKDFNGGASYSVNFSEGMTKKKLKKALTFKDENQKEYVPVIDSSASFTVRTDYLKKPGITAVQPELTEAITKKLDGLKTPYTIQESHVIGADAAPSERYDSSNLKNNFQTYWLKVLFHGANFKWVLLGFIVLVIGIVTLTLSSLSNSMTNLVFKRMQLFSSAAFSIGHGGNDAQKVMGIICAACMVFGNMHREGKIKGDYPSWLKVTEVVQIEYKDDEGRLKKFKPHPEGQNTLLVYTQGDHIYDAVSNEEIFHKKIFQN